MAEFLINLNYDQEKSVVRYSGNWAAAPGEFEGRGGGDVGFAE